MEIKKDQIFNLWDTNGRRHDVLNALQIYLEILAGLKEEYPQEEWKRYPDSKAQFLFYQRAVERSPEIFATHKKYDAFMEELGDGYASFLDKNETWIRDHFSDRLKRLLDEAIEARARHYTSNLERMGFVNRQRGLSEAGYSYLKKQVKRDAIEALLPIDDINLILLRQMLKLKLFSSPDPEGNRTFYSPFFMAVFLLLGYKKDTVDKEAFFSIVQGLNPYLDAESREAVLSEGFSLSDTEALVCTMEKEFPEVFLFDHKLPFDVFSQHIKNGKSGAVDLLYYEFYGKLWDFRKERSEEHYNSLVKVVGENRHKLRKAFGGGRAVFDMGRKGSCSLEEFLEKNAGHPFLESEHLNQEFCAAFLRSGRADSIREYSDTTERILGATGLFRFSSLPELAYREAFSCIFGRERLVQGIFGSMTNEEYQAYEELPGCVYRSSPSLTEILRCGQEEIREITERLGEALGARGASAIQAKLRSKVSRDFAAHIAEKYPREQIIKLLPLFSDRSRDKEIQKAVNDTASVPTIYEYITGIAWYYLSGQDFDLYDSLNMTLNADFEPMIHAGGGDGDIVIQYENRVVMLEATLMNKQAQKRGEWEPVLRHSLNLKAANEEKETMTFFIADELDHNTINIWRAVAAVSLESTNSHKMVDGVAIMPFTNGELLDFLKRGIPAGQIIEAVKASFGAVPRISDVGWKEEIMGSFGKNTVS